LNQIGTFLKMGDIAKKSGDLMGIARLKIHGGKLEEFKRLSAYAMEIVRTKDSGASQYDIYFNDDQSECMVLERYRDSEVLDERLANLGDLAGAILAAVSPLFMAKSSVSRAQSVGRICRAAPCVSSRPTCRCSTACRLGCSFSLYTRHPCEFFR